MPAIPAQHQRLAVRLLLKLLFCQKLCPSADIRLCFLTFGIQLIQPERDACSDVIIPAA